MNVLSTSHMCSGTGIQFLLVNFCVFLYICDFAIRFASFVHTYLFISIDFGFHNMLDSNQMLGSVQISHAPVK